MVVLWVLVHENPNACAYVFTWLKDMSLILRTVVPAFNSSGHKAPNWYYFMLFIRTPTSYCSFLAVMPRHQLVKQTRSCSNSCHLRPGAGKALGCTYRGCPRPTHHSTHTSAERTRQTRLPAYTCPQSVYTLISSRGSAVYCFCSPQYTLPTIPPPRISHTPCRGYY